MLLRDRYSEDTVLQFFPDFTILSFISHLAGLKPYYKYILPKDEQQKWNNKLTSYVPAVLFVGALIPMIFHKRIPKLKNFTSVKARILFGLLYLTIPIGAGTYISASSQAEIARKYQAELEDFKKYRQSGDPTYMNKKLVFIEEM